MTFEDDISISIIDLPCTVKGFTVPTGDGRFSVFLNARHSWEMQQTTLKHELRHIYEYDFESDRPVTMIERSQ